MARRAGAEPARPTVVLLVRHGTTPTTGTVLPGRARGLSLSDRGRREAEAAAARIARLERVAAVYASPLERAQETAEPIARARRLTVRTEPGLLEVDVGRWVGQRLDRLRKLPEWHVVQRRPSAFRFPGGESFLEVQARAVAAVAALAARHRGQTIVAVSHGDPIRLALGHAIGVHLDLFQRIQVAPASISAIGFHGPGVSVLTVNSLGDDLTRLGVR